MKICKCEECCSWTENKENRCDDFKNINDCKLYRSKIQRIISFLRRFRKKWKRPLLKGDS